MKLVKDQKLHIRRLSKIEIINAFKVMGNEYRMNMLLALKQSPGLNLDQVNGVVGGEFKNISTHMKKLASSGLVHKKYKGVYVQHFLTEYGKRAVQSFEEFTKPLSL